MSSSSHQHPQCVSLETLEARIFLDSLPPYRLTQSIEDVEAFFAEP